MEFFKIYRDCDTLRIRKWVVEFYEDEDKTMLLDRRRMFGGPLFKIRLSIKMNRMIEMQERAMSVLRMYQD